MNVSLKPEAQKFIEAQVRSGNFDSADAVVDAAIDRMIVENEFELDDQTIAAINRAEEQIDRGEGIEFEQFAAEMRKQIAPK